MRLVEQRVRRVDDEEAGARQRPLALRPDRAGADVELEPEDVGRAERGDIVEKMGVLRRLADRPP